MKNDKDDGMIYRSIAKKEYGLTEKQLAALPYEEVANPHYRSGPLARVYRRSDVERLANSLDSDDLLRKRNKRSAAAKSAAAKRAQQLIERANGLPITVHVLEKKRLILEACDNYNAAEKRERDGCVATENSEPEFLDRICVNFIRHCLTEYEDFLKGIKGKPGVDEAYSVIRERIMQEIEDKYPWLEEECWRQQDEWKKCQLSSLP